MDSNCIKTPRWANISYYMAWGEIGPWGLTFAARFNLFIGDTPLIVGAF